MTATKAKILRRRSGATVRHLEDSHQFALFRWSFYEPVRGVDVPDGARLRDYLVAIPNGGKRNPREAARMKGLGVTPGWPDTILALGRGGWLGAACELKKAVHEFRSAADAADAVSDEQRRVLDRLAGVGWATAVCYGWEHARTFFRTYLGHQETVGFVAHEVLGASDTFGVRNRTIVYGLDRVPKAWINDPSRVRLRSEGALE